MTSPPQRPVLASTYRLQLHAGFTFDDVRALLPYLADLGITHLYLSPITAATPGSTHGYDVVDPTRLNPEFGGDDAYARLVEEQRRLGLGQVVDIVPNHMGIASGAGNRYWEDVLRHGRASQYAHVFDVDWTPPDAPSLHDRVLLPMLGDQLEAVLERGELAIEAGDDRGGGWLRYFEHRLPLAPGSLEAWRAEAASSEAGGSEAAGAESGPASSEALRRLLERQHYRLGFWRDAKRDLNYRRFFTIDELIGVRTEDLEVFALTHDLVLRLAADGALDGLRIDHPDGLRDPEGYLRRLREALRAAGAPESYVVLEKILATEEALPETWDCDGTTGYDFMNELVRVFVAGEHEGRFTSLYREFAGREEPYAAIEDHCRGDVLRGPLERQFERLGRRLHEAASPGVDGGAFVAALRSLLARIAVYRTYHREDALDPAAAGVVDAALERALAEGAPPGADALRAVAALLASPPPGATRDVVLRLQQIMPAVQAKGLEDRAFYRYRRLLALNEVGGDPGHFGEPVEEFHQRLAANAERWPRRMLASGTHDHKRGEDVRARLAALSALPDDWAAALRRVTEALEPLQAALERRVAADDLYLLVQTLLGCHPAGMTTAREWEDELLDRLGDYMLKALREAAERTDWVDGDERYEEGVLTLVRGAVDHGALLPRALGALLPRVAHHGALLSLAQVVLKTAGPGVTDVYQGTELWGLSLVDPDNRRPVEFDLLREVLDDLRPALEDGPDGDAVRASRWPELLRDWRSGAVKAFVLARGLRLRRALPQLFIGGAYEPLALEGEHASCAIAFARRTAEASAIAVVPRGPAAVLAPNAGEFWRPAWADTLLRLPPHLAGSVWRDAYTGARIEGEDSLRLADVLGAFPVALLLRED